MPGTHRTPPDDYGACLVIKPRPDIGVLCSAGATEEDSGYAYVAPDALPALVAALAAHLTVDDRRALTRDLAAQDGDGVVWRADVRRAADFIGHARGYEDVTDALLAAVEAAR